MRHNYYYRKNLKTGELSEVAFSHEDFIAMGLPVMSIGMPVLESLELVNKWNRETDSFKFWL